MYICIWYIYSLHIYRCVIHLSHTHTHVFVYDTYILFIYTGVWFICPIHIYIFVWYVHSLHIHSCVIHLCPIHICIFVYDMYIHFIYTGVWFICPIHIYIFVIHLSHTHIHICICIRCMSCEAAPSRNSQKSNQYQIDDTKWLWSWLLRNFTVLPYKRCVSAARHRAWRQQRCARTRLECRDWLGVSQPQLFWGMYIFILYVCVCVCVCVCVYVCIYMDVYIGIYMWD